MKPTVLCVGNCGFDQSTLNSYLLSRFDATVLTADRAADADSVLGKREVDLVLVNRVFDRDGDSGIDWIRRRFGEEGAAAGSRPIRAMLISGYEDAQREAVRAGAVPGFGKSDLRSNLAGERIAAALETRTAEEEGSSGGSVSEEDEA
ncbi:MAG TPA: response regulator [Pirellulaceae bacterium]|nr:response regulator [Pirellulaceae bacterium]